MKKKLTLLALMATMATVGYGASIDHIQTYTPEYLGNQALTGMINNTSVYYNPAGLVNLQQGTYIQAGVNLAVGVEKMKYQGKEYKADLLQPIPNIAAYHVNDDSALYWTFGALGGGGDLKYKDGVPGFGALPDLVNQGILEVPQLVRGLSLIPGFDITKQPGYSPSNPQGVLQVYDAGSSAEGKNMYIQSTIGGAWKIDNKLSVSLGGRVVYGIRELKGNLNLKSKNPIIQGALDKTIGGIHADIDSKRTAWGYGVQLGLNYKATDRLNLALRYDSRVKMKFKAKGHLNNVKLGRDKELGIASFYPEYMPGTKVRRDMPAILALGASYKVTDNWTMALAGNYYFNKDAKLDEVESSLKGQKKINKIEAKYDNGWEVALGTEYRFAPKWAWLGSINYAYTGAKSTSYDDVEFALNSITLGTGLKYNPDEASEVVFAVSHFFYKQESGHYNQKYNNLIDNPKYDKQITAFGVSYTQRF